MGNLGKCPLWKFAILGLAVGILAGCQVKRISPTATRTAAPQIAPSIINTSVPRPSSDSVFLSSIYSTVGTPIPASWKTYNLPELGVSLRYPENWLAESINRYRGQDGFFELSTKDYAVTVFGTLRTICTLEANLHKTDVYGDYPLIFDWQGLSRQLKSQVGDGCGIFPSPDAPNLGEAVLFTRLSSDIHTNQVVVLRVDAEHFMGLVSTLRMTAYATPTPSSGNYTSPLCVLSGATNLPEVSQFADLTITEYPIVDAACHPYDHFDSFQSRIQSLDLKMDDRLLNDSNTYRADESNQIKVGQDTIAWKFDPDHLFHVGASSQLDVFRNGQVIYTLAIPQQDPGGGPVKALWSWNNHWILEVENLQIIDGEIQNHKLGYDEMFEWHLVNDHPFYFFRQTDNFGIVYNGEVAPKRYDELIHGFLCCDPSVYSLHIDSRGARFYAQRDGIWWYVVVETP